MTTDGGDFDALRELHEMVMRHCNTYGAYQDEVTATLPFSVLLQLTEAVERVYRDREAVAAQVAALTAERDAADELRQQQHHAKSIVMDSQQREIVGLREQVETLTAERDGLLTDLIHFAQTNHQAHHGDHSGTWLSCDRGSCPGLRRAVSRAHSASTPPAGAQGHQHDWRPAGFTRHPTSGGWMPTDQCRVCGAERYPYSPEVKAGAQEIAPEASEPMEQCEWCGRQYPRSEMNTMPWPDDEHTRRICDRCVDEPN